MAWIEFHGATIKRLKKFNDLKRMLNLSTLETMGLLGTFWGEVIELAEDGDISKWDADYLCSTVGLRLNPERVWSAMVTTGWINMTDDGLFLVHDWLEYAWRYLDAKYRTSNPDRLVQIKAKHSKTVFRPSLDGPPNQPNLTQPNQTKNNIVGFDFEAVWSRYPNKDGKKHALRHFNASVKTPEDYVNIQRALDNYLKSGRVFNGYVKNGSTWFNSWQDWIDYKEEICVKCKNRGKFVSATGYETVCDCPKGNGIRLSKS